MTQTILLGDAVQLNPITSLKKGEFVKFVSMDKLDPYTRKIQGFEVKSFSGGMKFRNKDTLLARITPCLENGKTAQVDFLEGDEVGAGSTEYVVMRAKDGITEPDFIYYLSISPTFRNYAIKSMIGTSGRQRVQNEMLANMRVELPDLGTQKRIADILGTIDEKIELNRRMNETLEQMGQAFFRHYFITKPEAEKWDKRSLGEFFPVKTGKKDANFGTGDGRYPFFTCAQTASRAPDYSFDGPAILIAGNGDFNIKYYRGKFEAYQRTYVLMPTNESLLGVLYFLMLQDLKKITGGSRGSVIKFITKGMIENYKIPLPGDDELVKFAEIFNELTINIGHNNKEIQTLTTLRDTLLPRLISGKVKA